jgi:pyruvate/2-oxoglutarate dehydrogenase complex dihydrolipoamide acyltransferase (E2) component
MPEPTYDFIYEGPPTKLVALGLNVVPGETVTGPATLVNVLGMRPLWVEPEARQLAHENGVDLAPLATNGSIKLSDVERAIEDRGGPTDESAAEAVAAGEQPAGVNATDGAIKLADEEGIDLSTVEGSGENGRIVKGDVEAAVAARDEGSEG